MTTRTIRIVVDPSGAEQGANRVNAANQGMQRTAKGAAGSLTDLDQAAMNLKDQLDPLGAAQRRYNQELGNAEKLWRTGRISMGEMTAAGISARARLDDFSEALQFTNGVSGTSRMAMQQLTFQVQDVAQGFAMGISPMTIFAQQSGQVGFALSGMNGKLGQVGQFLMGPWGIALTLAGAAVTILVNSLNDAEDAANEVAKATERQFGTAKNLKEAIEDLDEATGRHNKTQDQMLRIGVEQIEQQIRKTIATREQTKAILEQAEANLRLAQTAADISGSDGSGGGAASGVMVGRAQGRVEGLRAKIAANDAELEQSRASLAAGTYKNAVSDARAETDAAYAATREYERAMDALGERTDLTAEQIKQQTIAIIRKRDAAIEASRDEEGAAKRETTARNKAAREAERAAKAREREMEKAARARERWIEDIEQIVTLEKREAATTLQRLEAQYDPLTTAARTYREELELIAALEGRGDITATQARTYRKGAAEGQAEEVERILTQTAPEIFGKKAAETFKDESLIAAVAIGKVLGGSFGGILQDFAGLLQGIKSGDYNGVRGELGGLGTLLGGNDSAFGKAFSGAFKDLGDDLGLSGFTDKLGSIFGTDGKGLGAFAGKAGAGAAIGGVTDDVLGMLGAKSSKLGAQIGGAAGSFIPGVGPIIGSVAGGLLGGLFKSNRTAGAVVTGADSLTLGGKDKGNYEQASTLGGAVQEGLKSLADVLGGELGRFQVAIGTRGDEIRVNTRGDSLKGKNGARGFGEDAEAAVAYAIQDALADGALKGVSTFTQRILRGAGDLDKAVDTAAKYETVLKRLAEGTDTIGTQAKDFAKTFMDLSEAMRDAGATTAELANVEKLYAQERKTVMDQILAPLLDYQRELSGEGSGVTAMDRLNAATERYNQAEVDFKAGKITGDQFSEAGQERFGLARDVYGTSTREFQSIRQELLADAESALGTARGRFESGAPEQLQRENNEIAAKVYQQNVIANDNLKAIQEQLARISANGGLNFSFVNGGLSAR
ncbi:phage tail length tape measure family protein [Pacificimonas sp. ICDLI1SI03]